MNRHATRGLIVQTLYHMEVGISEKEDAVFNMEAFVDHLKEKALNTSEISLSEAVIEDAFTMDDYYFTVIDGIMANLEAIDQLIVDHIEGWSINRLNKVDKAILRLAVYEMMTGAADVKIIINEAVELTKNFTDVGDKKSPSFNNKLLDKISQKLKKE